MNYIKLLNSFYDRLETNPLSTSAIALWHALVHVNNKAGWCKEFSVAISVLRVKSGLSEKSVTNARNELKQKGYLDFRSRKGNQSALYQLIDLSVTVTYKLADSTSDKGSDNASGNGSALLNEKKPNEMKQDDKEPAPLNAFQFFEQEGFGTLSSFIADQLGDLIDSYGEEKLLAAMKETVLNGARNLKYVKAVLNNPKASKPKGVTRIGTNQPSNQRSNEQQSRIREANERRKRIAGI
ncbi:DnaD domain protein [Planococcus wigleyi]|uniref:DnaD domain protein n=1 Tax=Planococcus wigleyi TaxID=2762216 RepID=A0ABR8WA29_9BACL|nr:DnaD domain protein [Planococcus wigleyi]MBD8013859.1 DnaD domain protein [Planococcus wigleyi]